MHCCVLEKIHFIEAIDYLDQQASLLYQFFFELVVYQVCTGAFYLALALPTLSNTDKGSGLPQPK